MIPKRTKNARSIRRHLYFGVSLAVLLAAGLGGWAERTQVAGAVIASGQLVVQSNVKKVQHPSGGVIGELSVRDGQHVEHGQVVARLDGTQAGANLAIIAKGLDEFVARKVRLEAERDGVQRLAFPSSLEERAELPDAAAAMAGERRLFELRAEARAGEKSRLRERVAQLHEEIGGYTEQIAAKDREIDLIKEELKGIEKLWGKNLISFQRVTSSRREAARLGGERGQLIASSAQASGRIAEVELQIIQVDQNLRSEVARELSDVRSKIAELSERKVAAEDELKRIDIRAPQNGIVHQLAVHTVGGVIGAGDAIMLVVPDADELLVEARVPPINIDQLYLNQPATLRFSAFNQATTPELHGRLTTISADLTQDQRTGESYYLVRVAIPRSELPRLQKQRLVAGMPVEVFIQTASRTALSYLAKPLIDQLEKAFREE